MWLQSVQRVSGKLMAELRLDSGKTALTELDSTWELELPLSTRSKLFAVTRLAEWETIDATEYLAEMGIATDLPENRHQAFSINHNGLRLIIPAILMLKALFKPNATVFQYLFRPSGLDCLLAPVPNPGSMSVALLPTRIRQHMPIAERGLARLQWLYCFPTARKAFDSVYTNAARGVFGLVLPNIEARISVRGELRGRTLLVSTLTINSCRPLDAPFAWAGMQPQEFALTSYRRFAQLNPVLKNPDLVEGAAGWGLSDDEWFQLEHLFPPRAGRITGDRARLLIDAILLKLGTGVGWGPVNAQCGTTAAVSSYYQACRRSGTWEIIQATLRETRSRTASPNSTASHD
jgi:hypothetical protein